MMTGLAMKATYIDMPQDRVWVIVKKRNCISKSFCGALGTKKLSLDHEEFPRRGTL